MHSKKNTLLSWGSIAGIVALCGVAWCMTSNAPKFTVGAVAPERAAAAQKSTESTRLYDEVQYFGEKFSGAQQ